MTETLRVLGQVNPATGVNTALYTAPVSGAATVSTIGVCNFGAAATTFRMYIGPTLASATATNAVYYDVAIPGNDTFMATIGATLSAGQTITINGGNSSCSFFAYGVETL